MQKSDVQRLDKWLWYCRIVKSRTLAGAVIGGGKVRVNRDRVTKASHLLRIGDVVTATVAKKVRVLKVLAAGTRRGPAIEAQELFEDLTPETVGGSSHSSGRRVGSGVAGIGVAFARLPGEGRPTKRDRRKIDRLKGDRR